MAILLVDDENNTREALRNMLSELGHKTILEAKNGQEALKVLDSEKGRVRAVVADWEMPYMDGLQLLDEIRGRPVLDFAPFVLITSDLPRSKLSELQQSNPRLDAHLIKPFRLGALEKTLREAYVHRTRTRSVLLYSAPAIPPALSEAFASGLKAGRHHWTELRPVATGLAEAFAAVGGALGGAIFDPSRVGKPEAEWIATFRKTPIGSAAQLACGSRIPEEAFLLRNLCLFFADPAEGPPGWERLLAQMSSRALAAWNIELLFQELKPALQKSSFADARRVADSMLALDPSNTEAHAALGEIFEKLGDPGQALRHLELAMATNPCLPRPYLKSLELVADPARRSALADQASRFCPQSIDVLLAAAHAWRDVGEPARARAAAEKAVALNPTHPAARELLAALTAC